MDIPKHYFSKFAADTQNVFTFGYNEGAEILASVMLSDIGTYDLLLTSIDVDKVHHYNHILNTLHQNYIWTDLFDASASLRRSFLYHTTSNVHKKLHTMSDVGLSDNVLQFKCELVRIFKTYAMFLAYCDMESSQVFMWTNSVQALPIEVFTTYFDEVVNDITSVYTRFSRKIPLFPKIYLCLLDRILSIVEVREVHGNNFIVSPTFREIPKPSVLNPSDVRIILNTYKDRCNINELRSVLYLIYIQMIPVYIISTTKWMFTMNGIKQDSMNPLTDVVSQINLDFIIKFKSTVESSGTLLKQRLAEMPVIKQSLTIIEDKQFFENYTDIALGEVPMTIIGNLIRLYLRNVEIIVLSDMLFSGFYHSLNDEHQLSYKETTRILLKAETDLIRMKSTISTSKLLTQVMKRYSKLLHIAIKKVKRYHSHVCTMQKSDEDLNDEYENVSINLIFGDVSDNDGQPTICAICLDNSHEKKESWFALACQHKFHCSCLDDMVSSNNKYCPLCRKEM